MSDNPEKITLNLEKWRDATSDILGYTSPNLRTEIHRQTTKYGQQINVLEVDARISDSDPTILSSTSFDYRVDPLLARRMAILATHQRARVLVSELPGITVDHANPFRTRGAWQTPLQTLLGFRGNFDPLAAVQLRAMKTAGQLDDGATIEIHGGSLGAHAAAAMGRVIANPRYDDLNFIISRMVIHEPVNAYGNYSLLPRISTLVGRISDEARLRDIYLQENTYIGHGDIGAFETQSDENKLIDTYVKARQRAATYLSAAGLRKGLHRAIADTLDETRSDGPHFRGAGIIISAGVDSSISPMRDIIAAANTIRDHGGHARVLSLEAPDGDKTPMAHHVLDSLARFASYVDALAGDVKAA